ncbi:MAG TPA: rRNA maturation RNase YbeY [Chthoniobacteraceae bacterium]
MSIEVCNRQRAVRLNLPWLRRFAALALPATSNHSADGRDALRRLEEIEVALVSDRVIARVHRQFMNIAGPTDVITFDHGEIVISAETARRCAPEYEHSVETEIALYTVHGLLHLNGFEDASPADAARMHELQGRVWKQCLDQLPSPDSQ